MLNERDEITECSASNIFIVRSNKLLTPARECRLLMGTTMQISIEKMNVKEERLTVNDFYNASAIFITNSFIGTLPVVQFENKTYSPTLELLNSINSIIEEENSL